MIKFHYRKFSNIFCHSPSANPHPHFRLRPCRFNFVFHWQSTREKEPKLEYNLSNWINVVDFVIRFLLFFWFFFFPFSNLVLFSFVIFLPFFLSSLLLYRRIFTKYMLHINLFFSTPGWQGLVYLHFSKTKLSLFSSLLLARP